MDPVGAFADHLANLVKPNLSGIYAFQAAPDEKKPQSYTVKTRGSKSFL